MQKFFLAQNSESEQKIYQVQACEKAAYAVPGSIMKNNRLYSWHLDMVDKNTNMFWSLWSWLRAWAVV